MPFVPEGRTDDPQIYGPQAPTSLTNGPPFLEMQCEWIQQVLNQQRDQGLAVVEAKQQEEDRWRKQVSDLANMTLAIHTNSWYVINPSMMA